MAGREYEERRLEAAEDPPVAIETPPQALDALALQRTAGNQAVARMLQAGSAPRSIQRLKYKQDTFDRALTWAIGGTAKGMTFGKGSDRRKITQSSEEVAAEQISNFSAIDDIVVHNFEHSLTGRYYRTRRQKGAFLGKTILFLSGSGGSAETYSKPIATEYAYRGADLVAVNYRGFGGSTYKEGAKTKRATRDDLSAETFHSDARAIYDWMTQDQGIDSSSILVLGYSLGGPVAADLVASLAEEGLSVGGLILHSALDSIRAEAVRNTGAYAGNIGADAVGTEMNTGDALLRLADIDPDLPLMIMSGSQKDGDQLDIDTTQLPETARGAGMRNVFEASGPGHHLTPAVHLSSDVNSKLEEFLAEVDA